MGAGSVQRSWPNVAISFIVIAAFGPYIIPGIRTEQATIYGIFAIGAISLWWRHGLLTRPATAIILLLTAQLSLATAGVLLPVHVLVKYRAGDPIAGIDNLLLPAVIIATVSWIAWHGEPETMLRRTCTIVVVFACCNMALSVYSVTTDTESMLSIFWGGAADRPTTAVLALGMGRYSGIFNQPAEAGQFYSIAMLAMIYNYHRRPIILSIATVAISVGAALTVSKIFLLVGLPVGLWQIVRASGGRAKRLMAFVFVAIAGMSIDSAGVLPEWSGSGYLLRLLNPNAGGRGGLDTYTAGRFGEKSTLQPVIDTVMNSSPLTGFGADGLQVPYDNGWVESLVEAGIIGVVIYTTIIVVLAIAWWHRRKEHDAAWSRIMGGLVIVLIGASTGVTAMTVNRASTILWIIFALLLTIPKNRQAADPTAIAVPAQTRQHTSPSSDKTATPLPEKSAVATVARLP